MNSTDLEAVINLNLRKSDIEEVKASTGLTPKEALFLSVTGSKVVWVVIHKRKIEAVFGLVLINGIGVPWFLSSNKFSDFSITFAKQSKQVIKEMLGYSPNLENYVDYRHEASIKWLRWLGFTVNTSIPYILSDSTVQFYKFSLHSKEVDHCVYSNSSNSSNLGWD